MIWVTAFTPEQTARQPIQLTNRQEFHFVAPSRLVRARLDQWQHAAYDRSIAVPNTKRNALVGSSSARAMT